MRTLIAFTLLSLVGVAALPGRADEKNFDIAKFLHQAALGGLFEVQAGRLAATQGFDLAVRRFGERMVTDHGQANKDLAALALKKGITIPQELDSKHAMLLQQLRGLKGSEFDRAYIKQMVADHEKAVKEFGECAQHAHDADVKAFAAKVLPTLRQHLQEAMEIHARLGGKK
jgi:putative membrane protein